MLLDIIGIGVGLSMDAFAVSVCKGLSMKKLNLKKALIIGLYFGVFQMLMPLIGYYLASSFESIVKSIDHWIAFILLGIIGINMIREALGKEEEKVSSDTSFKEMIGLAIATSIDALAVGISFAFLSINICISVLIIGLITFTLSILGVIIGNKFGNKYEKKAEFTGGLILILIGLKILITDLFF